MTNATHQIQPDATDLLEDALRLLEAQPGWEDIVLEVIEAAEQRLSDVPLTPELETWLLLAGRLAAGRFTVAAAPSLIYILPDDPDPIGLDRPTDIRSHRRGVNQLTLPLGAL